MFHDRQSTELSNPPSSTPDPILRRMHLLLAKAGRKLSISLFYFGRALRGRGSRGACAAWRVENRHSPRCRMFTTSHADWLALKCGRACRPQMCTTPIDHAKRGLTCSKPPVVATMERARFI